MKFALGAMTVGEILDRGLKVLFSRVGAFYLISLIALSPLLVLVAAIVPALAGGSPETALLVLLLGSLLAFVLMIILQPIATAAILKIIQGEYLGERMTVGAALSAALGWFGTLLGTSILAGLMILLFLCLLIIPGIIAGVSYSFVGQVVVMEGLSGMDALDRSYKLAKGYRWRIFGILLLIGILNAVIQQVLNQALEMALPALGPNQEIFNFTNFGIHQLVLQLVNIFLQTYAAICTTLIYFDLRVRKEGYDLEVAARGQGTVAEPV
jgi:uncharacterized membrane protein